MKKKNNTIEKIAIVIFPFMILMSACVGNDLKELEERENEILEKYLSDNNISENDKTDGGIYFIEQEAGTGLSPEMNDFVVINYVGRYLEDGSIHETSYASLEDEWIDSEKYTYYVFAPVRFKYGYSIEGLNEGLALMKEGGKAKMVLPANKAFFDYKPMVYEIELIKVIKDPPAYESEVLDSYLNELSFDESTVLGSIYFKETYTPEPADEYTVQTGDTVMIRYTGSYVTFYGEIPVDTIVFNTNSSDINPLKIVYGTNKIVSGGILAIPKGLSSAIDSMRIGTQATAVLPYTEAFGENGLVSSVYKYAIVPPYQTVVYRITVEDIRSPER